MLNYIWAFLLLIGLVAGALFGKLDTMVVSMLKNCENVVLGIALPLAGIMMLWLGVLRVMEKAGLMEVVARALSPILRFVFPDVPRDHPAMAAITMNLAANMLGLGNSATPLGLKAMGHLQDLNPNKQSASNAMCMFLALNTAGFALIPIGAINYLSAGGVNQPHAIIAPAILATLCTTIVGVLTAKFFQKLPMFRVQPDDVVTDTPGAGEPGAKKSFRASGLRKTLIVLAALGFACGAVLQFLPQVRENLLRSTGIQSVMDEAAARKLAALEQKTKMEKSNATAASVAHSEEELPWWRKGLLGLSIIAIPAIILIVTLWGLATGIPVYEEMVEGAKEGFGVATRIMPFLVIMLTAMVVFRESGALTLLEYAMRPVLNFIGMPVELLPLAVMRPLSGSGSTGMLNDIILNPAST
ncbi:MAG TPA: nucleoside recognition domain-containing protein, partial [Flavobacteriales bacterium]|nr:nucleoside recognition domain-containing protein [Flavobacteriales bacterium]